AAPPRQADAADGDATGGRRLYGSPGSAADRADPGAADRTRRAGGERGHHQPPGGSPVRGRRAHTVAQRAALRRLHHGVSRQPEGLEAQTPRGRDPGSQGGPDGRRADRPGGGLARAHAPPEHVATGATTPPERRTSTTDRGWECQRVRKTRPTKSSA